jgi:DNA-damage-inducible protein J
MWAGWRIWRRDEGLRDASSVPLAFPWTSANFDRPSFENQASRCRIVAQGDIAMTNTVVRARINEQVKKEAAAVLATIGLTVSDAFRLMMMRIVNDKALPFEPLMPNAETIEAMKAARSGDLVTVGTPGKLLANLNADD